MKDLFLVTAILLLMNTVPCIYQAIKGPTIHDTVISMSILNTETVVIMLLLSSYFEHEMYLDISFVFAFFYFLVVYGTSRYIEAKGGAVGDHNQ